MKLMANAIAIEIAIAQPKPRRSDVFKATPELVEVSSSVCEVKVVSGLGLINVVVSAISSKTNVEISHASIETMRMPISITARWE
jgi:hypothetical protein